jgi:hypothetical protein
MGHFQTNIQILDCLEMESVGIFYGPLVSFTVIWYTYFMVIW